MEDQTIFGRSGNLPPQRPKYKPRDQQPKQETHPPTERKTRSDKKHDIKVFLSSDEKRRLKLVAFDNGIPVTAHASDIVKRALSENQSFKEYEYPDQGAFVHVVLEDHHFIRIQELAAAWDKPFRRVAHKILKDHLNRDQERRSNTFIVGRDF